MLLDEAARLYCHRCDMGRIWVGYEVVHMLHYGKNSCKTNLLGYPSMSNILRK